MIIIFPTSDGTTISNGVPVILNEDGKVQPAEPEEKDSLLGVVYPKTLVAKRYPIDGQILYETDYFKTNQWLQYEQNNNEYVSNPSFSPSYHYTQDPSQVCVCLGGLVAIRNGLPVKSSWIKLGDLGADTALYLIRN